LNNIHESELAGAYVLDALPAEEAAAFEDHLRVCADCRSEVAELLEVVDVLPLALDETEPPEALKERIMTEALRDEPVRPSLTAIAGGVPPRRSTASRLPQAVLAIAAALIIAALGVRDFQLQQKVDSHQVALQKEVVAALARGAARMPSPGTALARGASASMVQPLHSNTAYFVVRGLPPSPGNTVYQLWLVKGSTPTSAGTFTYSGSDPEVVQVPMAATGFSIAAVTVERGPHGSSHGPTGPKVLAGSLSA